MQKTEDIETKININSFEMIFNEYYRPLVRYGNSFVKDKDEAEDIVQQVFVNVWEKRDELAVHSSIRSMLYTSVYNACLNRIKHHKIRRIHADEMLHTQTDQLEDLLPGQELEVQLEQALSKLPEQCGKIFRMSRFEYLKYQEIADQLGISIKTVENQMGKALRILRESLREYMPLFIYFLSTLI